MSGGAREGNGLEFYGGSSVPYSTGPSTFYQDNAVSVAPAWSTVREPQRHPSATTSWHARSASFELGRALSGASVGEDEPPLLEELGIHPEAIWRKSLQVLNPLRRFEKSFADEPDMAGPLLYAFLLGMALLLRGKVHFGVIYGIAIVGCLSIYLVLNLMAGRELDLYRIVSVLGYGLLPIVVLAFLVLLVPPLAFRAIMAGVAVLWCTSTASRIFTAVLAIPAGNWPLVAYPVGLWYTSFALITVF
jgi:hypothetical protein